MIKKELEINEGDGTPRDEMYVLEGEGVGGMLSNQKGRDFRFANISSRREQKRSCNLAWSNNVQSIGLYIPNAYS